MLLCKDYGPGFTTAIVHLLRRTLLLSMHMLLY